MSDSSMAPVSAALQSELAEALGRYQIVVWLDRDDHYTEFVDQAQAGEGTMIPAPVLAYRGSYLELMLELEDHASSIDRPPVLVHLPGANEDTVKETPLLETYLAGYRFRKSLDTLVREAAAGRVPQADVDEFLGAGDVTLAEADAWMASRTAAASGELAAVLQSIKFNGLIDDLLTEGPVAQKLGDTQAYGQMWHHLAANLGLREDWPFRKRLGSTPGAAEVADVLASWALCMEYVDDLRRAPEAAELQGLGDLPRPLVDACLEACRHLRSNAPEYYAGLAREVEDMLVVERKVGRPEDLGRIDTFRFEEEQLFRGALRSLMAGRWSEAAEWAHDRLSGQSFWLEEDPKRRNAWILVAAAAALGKAVKESSLDYSKASSLGVAANDYAEHGAPVDQLHRHLEQQREALLYSRVPHYAELRDALDATRKAYRDWADRHARAWTDLCEREGMLPPSDLQQRRIFEDVVRPLLDDEDRTALFLVDGMRFEMARELRGQLGKLAGTSVVLSARLAELPSVTEVGMNALAPVAEGEKLRPVIKQDRRFDGFQTAGFRVRSPEDRKKAIHHRAGGATCPWYEIDDLLGMSAGDLRRGVAKARLTVVSSREIDAAGEKGTGLPVFAGAIRKVRRAWKLLWEAGVRRFVITSDHGFLLRTTNESTIVHGKKSDPMPRYVMYPENVQPSGQIAVTMRALGYEGAEGSLIFPRGLNVFESGAKRTYVHGGNSPQERVIPVLTLLHKQAPGSADLHYELGIEETGSLGGMHYVKARVRAAPGQKGLAFTDPPELDLDVRAPGHEGVQAHLCQAGDGARLEGGTVRAQVDKSFRLFFRLTAPRETRAQLELFHPSGAYDVRPRTLDLRFDVDVVADAGAAPKEAEDTCAPAIAPATERDDAWLDKYDDPGVRQVFAHLAEHGRVTEAEATRMLGGPRRLRAFSRQFERLVAQARFGVRIEVVGGTKHYVKESRSHD